MNEPEHRGRISFEEYSDRVRTSKRIRSVLVGAVIVLVLLCIGAVCLIVSLAYVTKDPTVAVSAQDDAALLLKETEDTQTTRASSEVVNLVELIGLTKNQAIEKIGRGAVVDAETPIDDGGLKKDISLSLTDERGTELLGTPDASLKVDVSDVVGAASYSAPLGVLGYTSISFIDAVTKFNVVGETLTAVGITNYSESDLSLPEKSAYSLYESDEKALKAETYTFSGTSVQNEGVLSWSATLHYDYAVANRTSNLANTVRKISISVRKTA